MKKFLALILSLCMLTALCVSFTGCGEKETTGAEYAIILKTLSNDIEKLVIVNQCVPAEYRIWNDRFILICIFFAIFNFSCIIENVRIDYARRKITIE
mgnify:CR=1 FL=1